MFWWYVMKNMKIKSVMFTETELCEVVKKLSAQINRDYKGEDSVTVVCVLTGAVVFTCDLIRKLNIPNVKLSFIRASSYGSSDMSSGSVKVIRPDNLEITNNNIIVVEDIIDTGNTIKKLKEIFLSQKPKTLKFCTMFDKPSRRKVDFKVDYIGEEIPDEFIVGYGLDYDDMYRNLPYVAILCEDN